MKTRSDRRFLSGEFDTAGQRSKSVAPNSVMEPRHSCAQFRQAFHKWTVTISADRLPALLWLNPAGPWSLKSLSCYILYKCLHLLYAKYALFLSNDQFSTFLCHMRTESDVNVDASQRLCILLVVCDLYGWFCVNPRAWLGHFPKHDWLLGGLFRTPSYLRNKWTNIPKLKRRLTAPPSFRASHNFVDFGSIDYATCLFSSFSRIKNKF